MSTSGVAPGYVAVITETFHPEINGVSNTLRQLTQGMLRAGLRVQVIRPRQLSRDRSRVIDGVEHVTGAGLPLPGYADLRFGLPAKHKLLKLWRHNPPRSLYVATEGPLGWSAVSAARQLRIPVISGFHTNFQSYSRYYGAGFLEALIRGYLRLFHNRTHITLVPTQQMQMHLADFGIQRVQVLSRGVDCHRFSPTHRDDDLRRGWGVGEQGTAVIYVGRLAPEKNLQLAIRCFQRLHATDSRLKFVLVGDGPLAAKLKAKHPEFIFCGLRTGQDLARHYASGDLFLFPSKTDTFGNVVIEAMASGLAVVGFNDAACAEHIQHEGNGMTASIDDDEGFVHNALSLVSRPSLMVRIRANARQHAISLHWDHIVTQFIDYLTPAAQEIHRHVSPQGLSSI